MFCLYVCLYECVGYRGTGLTESCKLPSGCWELKLCHLEERPACLIAALSDHNPVFFDFLRQDFLVRMLAMKHHDEKAIWEGLFSLLFNIAVHLKRCQ